MRLVLSFLVLLMVLPVHTKAQERDPTGGPLDRSTIYKAERENAQKRGNESQDEREPASVQRKSVKDLPPPAPVDRNRALQTTTAAKNVLEREILVYTERAERISVRSALSERNLPLLQEINLNALGHVVFITRGSAATLQDLQQSLRKAEVDWNGDLSASRGPRLYAREAIKWPTDSTCLDGITTLPIGLVDGRIDKSHPAFADQIIVEKNFLRGKDVNQDHATAIASILIGNAPDEGFDGLMRGARIYSAVVLRNAPHDKKLASVAVTLESFDWLLSQNVRLINVSLAGEHNRVLERLVDTLLKRGMLIFAAAGNNGPDAPPAYPAAIDGVFAITAIDAAGRPYKHANKGNYIDLAAPGVDIWAATAGGSGAYKSGTSFAVPYALAVSAIHLQNNPNIAPALLAKILQSSGGKVTAPECIDK